MIIKPRHNQALKAYLNPKSVESEAFKILRTNLQFLTVDREVRTMIITSTAPHEGKTTVLANLAIAIGQTGKKVLIVDADLRLPIQHKLFSVNNFLGLTTVLVENAPLEECIEETKAEGVWLLPSGPIPPNPSELLASDKMTRLIGTLAGMYDYVIFDTPPVLAVTDSVLLATKVDGVIMVVDAGNTQIEIAKEAVKQLQVAKARILGAVLNSVERRRDKYYYYHYYGEKK